jgi:ribonucleoside-diphosphate reductase alpha chain
MISITKAEMNTTITLTEETIKEFLYDYEKYIDTKWVDLDQIVTYVKRNLPDIIKNNDFYNFVADYCVSKTSYHPDYNTLASRICVDRLHKSTTEDILDVVEILYNNTDTDGAHHPLVSEHLLNNVRRFYKKIKDVIKMERDYLFDYFGIRTLERSYLLKIHKDKTKQVIERPQHMIMRVALGIHGANIDAAIETYELISQRYFTHATPTLFNAGRPKQQFSSCFLLGIDDDLDNIFSQIKQMALISKWAGGLGVHMSGIRAKGSVIRGTNGISDGIIPLAIMINKLSKYVNQGGNRPGSVACYLEPYHADIFEFCELRKTTSGNDDNRARDLYLALWIPDLFMKRVEEDGMWSLMCPDSCPNLATTHGQEFEKLYTSYESDGKYKKQVKARDLWKHIIECQMETGFPYMLYKDHANNKSNQKNLGTIRSSNLCAEIVQYSDGNTVAVCNLASICLPKYVVRDPDTEIVSFDYDKLIEVVRIIIRNLNKIIDRNYYPTESARESNIKQRPVGLGIQGLVDVYNAFEYAYDSEQAQFLNKKIFETIYYAALYESKELAKKYGAYSTFKGSPFSEGKLQFHLWGMTSKDLVTSDMYDWNTLVEEIKVFGTRNSLLTALMPTAGTSQIMKCYESFEPYLSNVFVRTTMAGEFIVINEKLIYNLIKEGLWNDDMRKLIIIKNGSIQSIDTIPKHIKDIYKTAFEISLKSIISQSADRAPFIDQSQSINLFMAKPDFTILTSAHFYGWKRGLKTGMYYLRTTSAVNPIQFGIDITDVMRLTGTTNAIELMTSDYNIRLSDSDKDKVKKDDGDEEFVACPIDPEERKMCLSCSS